MTKQDRRTNVEVVVYALYQLGGAARRVHKEDIGILLSCHSKRRAQAAASAEESNWEGKR